MKKFFKAIGIIFCGSGLICYIVMAFTADSSIRPILIFMAVLMGFFLFLLLRKPRPSIKLEPEINKTLVNTNLNPNRAINSMKGTYTIAQAKDHIRILQDCLNIIEKTKNLDTFFSRSEYGMQIALTLNQAQQAGIIPQTSDFPSVFFKAVHSQKERILGDSFWDQKEKIAKYTTPKTKINHWNQYLELLNKYSDQFDLEFQSEFQEIQDQVLVEISKAKS